MMKTDNGNRLAACGIGLGIILILAMIFAFLFLARTIVKGIGPGAAEPSQDMPDLPGPYGLEPKKGMFLVASRRLGDPRFQETVVLLIRHDKQGSVGLIINRPTKILVSEMLPDVPALKNMPDTVYYGGPVEPGRIMLIIRTERKLKNSVSVINNVYVSGSREILDQLVTRPAIGDVFRVYAGYAGWASGQLRAEIVRGDWHVIQADAKTIFSNKAEDIWPMLIRKSSSIYVLEDHLFTARYFRTSTRYAAGNNLLLCIKKVEKWVGLW